MTICIFPGTFNPIHNAHIKIAEFVLRKYNFEKIIFIPSYIPPHKDVEPNLAQHRLNMVKLAIRQNPKFEVSDIEYQYNSKSYTLITVNKLIETYNIKEKINFIIGADAFVNLNSWYKADELKTKVHFIVFPRKDDNIVAVVEKYKDLGWDFELTNTDYINISSTEVRAKKLKSVDKNVEDYISKNGLYKA